MPLTVLITNMWLSGRSGTEIVTRNVALGLLRRGHRPLVYAQSLGPGADELRRESIPVTDDIALVESEIDVIHGHHNPTTATAVARFPHAPAVFVAHDFLAWHDAPPLLPSIRRYVAVDETVADRLRFEGIAPGKISVLLNAVDTERFRYTDHLPNTPARALLYAKNPGHVDAIREACARHGISTDVVGWYGERMVDEPERLLANYDLVFATALSALEAMACGRAVISCDGRGLAGFVNAKRYEAWRPYNFGLRTLREKVTTEAIERELERYDVAEAHRVAERTRDEANLDRYIERLVALYERAIAEGAADPVAPEAAASALAAHLQRWAPRVDLQWPWMRERDSLIQSLDRLEAGLQPVPLDAPVSFAKREGVKPRYAGWGLSEPETWGTWTLGNEAGLIVQLPPESGDVVADFTCRPLLHEMHPELNVEVLVNGLPLTAWNFRGISNDREHRAVEIPRRLLGPTGRLWVVFRIDNPRSPFELGVNADRRPLGLGLVEATFRSAPG